MKNFILTLVALFSILFTCSAQAPGDFTSDTTIVYHSENIDTLLYKHRIKITQNRIYFRNISEDDHFYIDIILNDAVYLTDSTGRKFVRTIYSSPVDGVEAVVIDDLVGDLDEELYIMVFVMDGEFRYVMQFNMARDCERAKL